jgi:hypothetical protein
LQLSQAGVASTFFASRFSQRHSFVTFCCRIL